MKKLVIIAICLAFLLSLVPKQALSAEGVAFLSREYKGDGTASYLACDRFGHCAEVEGECSFELTLSIDGTYEARVTSLSGGWCCESHIKPLFKYGCDYEITAWWDYDRGYKVYKFAGQHQDGVFQTTYWERASVQGAYGDTWVLAVFTHKHEPSVGGWGTIETTLTFRLHGELESAVPLTEEYFKTEYDISVIYGDKAWCGQELKLLYEVFNEDLCQQFWDKVSLRSIRRNKAEDDKDVFGDYRFPQSEIRIFDYASYPYDFTDEDVQFKGTIVHELTHAIQYCQYYDSLVGKTYPNLYENLLVQDYAKKTKWKYDKVTGVWKYKGDEKGLPTKYGGKNPLEDMAESAMLYVYDPTRLCKIRYKWLEENIFNGK